MDSDAIDRILRKNCAIYRGVFACDELPDVIIRPSVIVVNTDPAKRPGQHWICIYFDENLHGEFFDSFGAPPKLVFERYMEKIAPLGRLTGSGCNLSFLDFADIIVFGNVL